MDQAVGIGLGQEHTAAVESRLRTLAVAQGTRWDGDRAEASAAIAPGVGAPVRRTLSFCIYCIQQCFPENPKFFIATVRVGRRLRVWHVESGDCDCSTY